MMYIKIYRYVILFQNVPAEILRTDLEHRVCAANVRRELQVFTKSLEIVLGHSCYRRSSFSRPGDASVAEYCCQGSSIIPIVYETRGRAL